MTCCWCDDEGNLKCQGCYEVRDLCEICQKCWKCDMSDRQCLEGMCKEHYGQLHGARMRQIELQMNRWGTHLGELNLSMLDHINCFLKY